MKLTCAPLGALLIVSAQSHVMALLKMDCVTVVVPGAYRPIYKIDDARVFTVKVALDGIMIVAGICGAVAMFDEENVVGSVSVCIGAIFMMFSIFKGFFENKQMAEGFNTLSHNIKIVDENMEILKEDVRVLKEDVKVLKEDVKVLKEDVKVLKEDVAIMKSDISEIKGILAVIVKKLGIETNMLTGPAVLDTNHQVAFEMHMAPPDHEPQAQDSVDTIVGDFVAGIFDRVMDRDTSDERAADKAARTEANKVGHPADAATDLEAREKLQSKMRRRIGFKAA